MNEEIIAKLTEEYLAHIRSGQTLSPEEFADQHPEHRVELLELLPMLSAMEEISKTQPCSVTPVRPLKYPDRLGEFILHEKLGSGGMGTVFKAIQTSLNREVALKILAPIWSDSEELLGKFENESKLIAALHHPHIVQVFGAGREGDYSFYVMELIAGRSIKIETKRSAHEVARLGLQAAQALAYAHSNHILHRDVKPSNFLLDANGDLHISDFGIATMLNEQQQLVTQSREGTLRYMAPEQLLKNESSCASDQYALGATLYELLTNKPIFTDDTPGAVVRRIEYHEIKPLVGIPRDLAAIVEKSLSYSPADRYASLSEIAADLQRFLSGEAVKARRSSVFRRIILWAKRRPAVAAWSTATILLAFGLLTALLVGYLQTKRALAIADRTLYEIFNTYSDQPGSRNTALLERLLPYYEMVANQRKVYANEVVGAIALRSGKLDVAERAFRNTPDRFHLAQSLALQGKRTEAEAIWRELAQKGDIIAVRSLRALAGQLRALPGKETPPMGNPELMRQAWELLNSLRQKNQNDASLRYLAASILAENPRIGRGENALELLKELVAQYPQNAEYRLLLIRLAGKINPRNPQFEEQMQFALQQANELLIRHPNEPEVLATVADIRLKYAASLAQKGENHAAVVELQRAIGLYEIIAKHPDAPADGLEKLQEFELRQNNLKRKMEKIQK